MRKEQSSKNNSFFYTYRESHTSAFGCLASSRHGSGRVNDFAVHGHDTPTLIVFVGPAGSRLQVGCHQGISDSQEKSRGQRRLLVVQEIH